MIMGLYHVEQDNKFTIPSSSKRFRRMPDKKLKEIAARKISKIKFKNMEDYWINSIGKTLYKKI